MNVLNEYPKALAAYSTRRLSTTYVGEPYKREVSGYISTWYDQSGNGNDAHWSFEIETNSMLCYLRHEMSQDFQDIALDIGLKTEIKFPTCVIWRGLETATIPKHQREMEKPLDKVLICDRIQHFSNKLVKACNEGDEVLNGHYAAKIRGFLEQLDR